MLIHIYGPDTFRSRVYLRQTIERFKKERDPQGLNVFNFDGTRDDEEKILNTIVSAPFLAAKRMIVAQNILSRKDTGLLSTIAELIKNKKLPENNVVVFWQGEDVGKTKIAKELDEMLRKEKWAMAFAAIPKATMPAWIVRETEQRGGRMEPAAVNYLTDHSGGDLWLLNSLIDQLTAYASGNEIRLADARIFLEEKVDDNIFNLVDAIVAGNKKTAFQLLEGQRRAGEDEGYIYQMILRQFRILISMRDLHNRRDSAPSDALARELGLHPFVVKKSLALMKKYSLEKLKNIYQELLDIDIKTKTGQGDQSLMIDVFVGKNS